MIKCGDKLEGKPQCILYSKDGSKVLGRFPYSKYGGEKGAKAAAHRREGAVQFFKKKHQGLLDALETFGAPMVLKYLLEKAADCEACQEVVKAYVEGELPDWLEKAKKKYRCYCDACDREFSSDKPCTEVPCPHCGEKGATSELPPGKKVGSNPIPRIPEPKKSEPEEPEGVEKARGEGQGVGGPKQGDGGTDTCVCPECGATAPHERGKPCAEVKCPKCGVAMQGQAAEKSEPEGDDEVEKAEGDTYKPPPGWNDPKSWLSSKKGAEAIRRAAWNAMGGKQHLCADRMAGKVDDPDRFCAALKDAVTGTTKWRKGRGKAKKSFTDEIEEALTMLEKDEADEETTIDLAELERFLESEWEAETEATPEPEPVPEVEPEPEPEPPPEPEPAAEPEELPNDFHTLLLQSHAQKQAGVLAMLGEEVDDGQGD